MFVNPILYITRNGTSVLTRINHSHLSRPYSSLQFLIFNFQFTIQSFTRQRYNIYASRRVWNPESELLLTIFFRPGSGMENRSRQVQSVRYKINKILFFLKTGQIRYTFSMAQTRSGPVEIDLNYLKTSFFGPWRNLIELHLHLHAIGVYTNKIFIYSMTLKTLNII